MNEGTWMIVVMVFVAIATLFIGIGLTYKIFMDYTVNDAGKVVSRNHSATPMYIVLLVATLAIGIFLILRLREVYMVNVVYDSSWQKSVP